MKKVNVVPKYIVFCFGVTALIDACALVLGAFLIEGGSLAFDAMGVWSLASLVLASMLASFSCTSRSGAPLNAYAAVFASFFLIAVLIPMGYGLGISFHVLIKAFTALLCGTFIGNYLGMGRHNRLRNFRKKRRTYTK
ncbi:MAG: hypothetical protein IJA67_04590 [Oscillospiraceae bacterium]|nr:hypothetical protein [Oscillospiraceae bacterium]